MKPEYARALWIFALLLAVVGSMVSNPGGGFFLSVVAALVALPAVILGTGSARLGGVIACVLSLALAVADFPVMQKDQAEYAERARSRDRATSAAAPGQSGEPTSGSSQNK